MSCTKSFAEFKDFLTFLESSGYYKTTDDFRTVIDIFVTHQYKVFPRRAADFCHLRLRFPDLADILVMNNTKSPKKLETMTKKILQSEADLAMSCRSYLLEERPGIPLDSQQSAYSAYNQAGNIYDALPLVVFSILGEHSRLLTWRMKKLDKVAKHAKWLQGQQYIARKKNMSKK
jgi:hypothetical protein